MDRMKKKLLTIIEFIILIFLAIFIFSFLIVTISKGYLISFYYLFSLQFLLISKSPLFGIILIIFSYIACILIPIIGIKYKIQSNIIHILTIILIILHFCLFIISIYISLFSLNILKFIGH